MRSRSGKRSTIVNESDKAIHGIMLMTVQRETVTGKALMEEINELSGDMCNDPVTWTDSGDEMSYSALCINRPVTIEAQVAE
jgi:hypothetical protein